MRGRLPRQRNVCVVVVVVVVGYEYICTHKVSMPSVAIRKLILVAADEALLALRQELSERIDLAHMCSHTRFAEIESELPLQNAREVLCNRLEAKRSQRSSPHFAGRGTRGACYGALAGPQA